MNKNVPIYSVLIKQDMAKAIEWYEKSAAQGDYTGQYSLGDCYANGKGVKQDINEAVKWYKKSAEQGLHIAQYSLGNCYYEGTGLPKDKIKAYVWYALAVESGSDKASENIKKMEAEGITPEEFKTALELLKKYKNGNFAD